ncbi:MULTISPECIES: hypothetical protein [unclassified Microbacterium]|uniref:hypothetical protein n=1 Tax=unclassified Microbacterium TaxID=2609290 RepID=UPI00160510E0|nr:MULTISPECIES: hypothetical protein [unclassified Microbacterium]QNA93245.1 hypothetical protein G4G29_14665 [Microbacterium sp. Se63.02b]QYM63454.1 hypothetical protein K1X59_14715 [Microbacterium sp. Se5.02b]
MWIALVAACATLAGAVFTYVQARAATDTLRDARDARDEAREARDESARLAGEANTAFIRQAEAQEEANRIKREEMTPKDWSAGEVGESKYRVSNSSGEALLVSEFDVTPDATANLLTIESSHQDGRYEYGDTFTFYVAQIWGPSPEKLTIRYRRESDPEDDQRIFHISL